MRFEQYFGISKFQNASLEDMGALSRGRDKAGVGSRSWRPRRPPSRDDGSTRARRLRRGRSLLAGGHLFTRSCLSRASTRASRGRILATMTWPRGAPTSVQDLGSPTRARARARSRARPSASRTSFDVDRPRGDAAKDARRRSPPHPPGRGAAMRRRRRQKEAQIAFRRPPRRLDGSPRPQIVEFGGD